jgi:outer membrane lipoprotein-sorting protein
VKHIASVVVLFVVLSACLTFAQSEDVKTILQKSDDLMRGATSYGEFEMQVTTPRWKRTMSMLSWSEGTKKSFIKVTYPERDKGVTFLRLDNEMWQYVPKVERVIKIPPSMMLQSWMGSDFTNDDLAKESSIVNDYTSKLLAETKTDYKIECIPRPDAAVTWGKVIMWVAKGTYVPIREEFYDEEGVLIRVMTFENVQKLPDRSFPFRWVMTPQTEDKKGNTTVINVKKTTFNEPVEPGTFTLEALKRLSK